MCQFCQINATSIAAKAGIHEQQFVTRSLGKRFLPALQQALRQAFEERGAQCLVLSFTNVHLMDASFADEVFASIASARSRRSAVGGYLVLRDLDPTSHDNLVLALMSRPTRETGLRNCALPVFTPLGKVELVGKTEDHLKRTFEFLKQRGELTARELAESEGLDIGAASTRLKMLFDLGLACRQEMRDERGRSYVYGSVR